MMHSMTGFGRASKSEEGWMCSVELRSVNGRYLESRIRLPSSLLAMEEGLKKQIQAKCERGKIECSISLVPVGEGQALISLNAPLLRGLEAMLAKVEHQLGRSLQIGMGDLLAVKDLVRFDTWEGLDESVGGLVTATLDEALVELVNMRKTEGQSLHEELETRGRTLGTLVEAVMPLAAEVPAQYGKKLRENLIRLNEGNSIPEERIIQETALFAERCDVTEELTRFKTHLEHLSQILSEGGAVGRKIEFLLQELNREANTLGVKCNDTRISEKVIEMKSELEKLREQIQNVE